MEFAYDARYADLFASPAVTRSSLLRQVLHRGSGQSCLLPVDLPRADGERKERSLLCYGGGRRGSWFSALPALPSRVLARNSGLAWNVQHGLASLAPDR